MVQNKVDYSSTIQHSQKCDKGVKWGSVTTLKVENNKFDRKYGRHSQYHECGPKKGGMNLDSMHVC